MTEESVVLGVAREQAAHQDIVVLSTGVRARIRPVAAALLDTVRARLPMPRPPVQMIPEKGREEENPFDPEYLRQVDEVNRARNLAVGDAAILFGVELCDGMPDDGWEIKLGLLGITVGEDALAREFAYKKYIAVAAPDLRLVIAACTGVSEEQVAQATEFFRNRAGGQPDSAVSAKA